MKSINKQFSTKDIILSIFIIIVSSALSGGVSGYFASHYNDKVNDNSFSNFYISSTTKKNATNTSTVTDLTDFVTTTRVKLLDIDNQSAIQTNLPDQFVEQNSSVGILYNTTLKQGGWNLLKKQEVQRVLAVTSDGWFISVNTDLDSKKLSKNRILYNHRLYQLKNVYLDKATNILFIKTEAKNLKPISFANLETPVTGLTLLLEKNPHAFNIAYLSSSRTSDYPVSKSSDKAEHYFMIQAQIEDAEVGAPIWDLNASLFGLAIPAKKQNYIQAIPGSVIASSLQGLINNQKIKHAKLGVYTINLGVNNFFIDHQEYQNFPKKGAYITNLNSKQSAIIKDSPAEKAGLQKDDVILAIDHDIIDNNNNLSDIIIQYKAGSKVDVRIWRQNKELVIPITLGEQITNIKLF